jgi:hypothetical protein
LIATLAASQKKKKLNKKKGKKGFQTSHKCRLFEKFQRTGSISSKEPAKKRQFRVGSLSISFDVKEL